MEDLKEKKSILRSVRTRETYRSKLESQSPGSQIGVSLTIDNFSSRLMVSRVSLGSFFPI